MPEVVPTPKVIYLAIDEFGYFLNVFRTPEDAARNLSGREYRLHRYTWADLVYPSALPQPDPAFGDNPI